MGYPMIRLLSALAAVFGLAAFSLVRAQPPPPSPLIATPDVPTAIYRRNQPVHWLIHARPGVGQIGAPYHYTIKENGLVPIAEGDLRWDGDHASLTAALDHPGMLYLEVTPAGGGQPSVAGAAVDPTNLQPDTPCPADFDAFWAGQIRRLEAIPPAPVLTPADSGHPGVDYSLIRMDNIDGSHIYGQIARPAGPGKHPAMLILQWAGVYPLQPSWVVDRAAAGWLALDIEAHDFPGNLPANFYTSLPALLQHYNTIYDDDRTRCYFLRMYLGAYRAAEYLARRPDWDGKILLAFGTSMGGQQSLAVAGLNRRITHVIVEVPAGEDADAALHGRAEGYPFWDLSRSAVAQTGRYFDTVNFAARIRAPILIGFGFVDTICPPANTWTAINRITAPKELIPLIDAPHNNTATMEQQRPYFQRSQAWLDALVHDREPALHP